MGSLICGLVGVVGDIWLKDKKAFDLMLKFDTHRGPHSTGVARVGMDNKVEVVKGVGTPWHLINEKPDEYYNDKMARDIQGNFKVLMGHNRWATVGEVNEANAHPFTHGKITGAHNGTLEHRALWAIDDDNLFGTDSECVMHNFNRHGAVATIPKLSGAWCFTWYDSEEDTFNLIRNKERPMYFAWAKSGKTFYYASEAWIIETALDKVGIEHEGIKYLIEDTLNKFYLNNIPEFGKKHVVDEEIKGWVYTPRDWSQYVSTYRSTTTGNSENPFPPRYKGIKELKSLADSLVGRYMDFVIAGSALDAQRVIHCDGRLYRDDQISVRVYYGEDTKLFNMLMDENNLEFVGKVKKAKLFKTGVYVTFEHDTIQPIEKDWSWENSLTKETDIKEVMNDAIPFEVVGWNGQPCTEVEFYQQTHNGCAWCSVFPEHEESKTLQWFNKETFVCEDCSKDEYVRRYAGQNYTN